MSWPEPRHPIIALWSHPRSMSTATERIMRERGDLTCFHEPFMYYYYVHLGHRQFPHHQVDPAHPTGFREIWRMLYKAAESRPVFFKDMAYYVVPEILSHPELAGAIRHAFLIRDPRRSILSYHRLDPELTLPEIGFESEHNLAEWIAGTTGRRPPVIEAETIQREPRSAMRALWAAIGLADRPDALRWSEDSVPEDWQHVAGWHRGVSASTEIRPLAEDDAAIDADFAAADAAAPRLAGLLAHHLPFYRRLQAWAMPPGKAPAGGDARLGQ
jgi:hypothetical protein